MNVFYLISVILTGAITLPCLLLSAYWLRKAARYNEIRRKLYAREPLTAQQQRLLDKTKP